MAELGDLPDDKLTEDYSNYGPLKALCEQAVADVFGERQASVRPGLIVGANDPTGRFTYWPHRVARGGRGARAGAAGAPGAVHRREGSRRLARRPLRAPGAAASTTRPTPAAAVGEVLEICREVSGSDATFEWVPPSVLQRARGRRVDGAAALDLRPGRGRDARGGRLPRGRGRPHASGRSRRRCATRSSTRPPSRASGSTPEREAELLAAAS